MNIPHNTAFSRSFQAYQIKPKKKRQNENLKKAVVLASSAAGMLIGLTMVGKMQRLKPFTLNGYKKINYDDIAMTTIAGSSLVGGLCSGIIVDSENKKSKLREGLQQTIGNIIFPIFTATKGEKLFSKVKDKIKMPQIKSDKPLAKAFNYVSHKLRKLPQVLAVAASLGVGLIVGNKVANFVNNLIFDKKEHRKLKFSDLSGHLDDACFATTLVAKGTSLGDKIAKFIPPALIVPGYVTGTKTCNDTH